MPAILFDLRSRQSAAARLYLWGFKGWNREGVRDYRKGAPQKWVLLMGLVDIYGYVTFITVLSSFLVSGVLLKVLDDLSVIVARNLSLTNQLDYLGIRNEG